MDYLPAAGSDTFLPLYDPLTWLLGMHGALDVLIGQADLSPGHAILDVGCGTGTLAVRILVQRPDVVVAGLDPDPKALARARVKARRARVAVRFHRGTAGALPYEGARFDRVLSTMMFHHLRRPDRAAALAEIHRVLRPGGRLEFLDFSSGSHSLIAQVLHGRALSDNAHERLTALFAGAGFVGISRTHTRSTLAGTLAYYQATRP